MRCVAFQRVAEICGEYIDKGRELYLEGRLQTRKYTDRNEEEKTVTEVVIWQLRLLGGKNRPNGTEAAPAAGDSASQAEDLGDCPF